MTPESIDERTVAQAIREYKVVPSYGPLIHFSIDGAGVGSDVSGPTGSAEVAIQVQAPRWMSIDRVELYENGRMIHEFVGEEISRDGVVKIDTTWSVQPTDDQGAPQDAWYVAVAMGEQDLSPVFTPVGVAKLELNEIVVGALSSLDLSIGGSALASESVPFERTYSMFPFAFTNPIWLDVDGDVNDDDEPFEALGRIPEWFRPAPE